MGVTYWSSPLSNNINPLLVTFKAPPTIINKVITLTINNLSLTVSSACPYFLHSYAAYSWSKSLP